MVTVAELAERLGQAERVGATAVNMETLEAAAGLARYFDPAVFKMAANISKQVDWSALKAAATTSKLVDPTYLKIGAAVSKAMETSMAGIAKVDPDLLTHAWARSTVSPLTSVSTEAFTADFRRETDLYHAALDTADALERVTEILTRIEEGEAKAERRSARIGLIGIGLVAVGILVGIANILVTVFTR